MKKHLLDELGKAAYEARKSTLIVGAYSDQAAHIPDSTHFYEWDKIPGELKDSTQWLYRKEAQGVLDAFLMYVYANGSAEAVEAMEALLKEIRDLFLTDEEQAIAESVEIQICEATIIQDLANKDEMPATSVVQDFYKTEKVNPSLEDRWEIVPDHLLANLDVPGYPDICPYKAWHVVTSADIWMIYTWYEGTGGDDDVWLYDKIKGKRLEAERVAYDFRDAMEKIQNIGRE